MCSLIKFEDLGPFAKQLTRLLFALISQEILKIKNFLKSLWRFLTKFYNLESFFKQ